MPISDNLMVLIVTTSKDVTLFDDNIYQVLMLVQVVKDVQESQSSLSFE